MNTLIELAEEASLSININLNDAVELLAAFFRVHPHSAYYQDYCLILKLIATFPTDIQIALMSHTQKMGIGLDAVVKEGIQVRLELEDSHRELTPDVWREVHKKI